MNNSRIVKFRRASGTDWFNALSYNGKTYDGTDDGTGWKGIPYLLPGDDQDSKGTDEKKVNWKPLLVIGGLVVLVLVLLIVLIFKK